MKYIEKGFTLFEMITVLILVSLLAVIVTPHFLDSQREGRIKTLEAFKGAFLAADSIVMQKAMTAGLEHSKGDTLIPGTDIYVRQGMMTLTAENVERAMNIDGYKLITWMTLPVPMLLVVHENNYYLDEQNRPWFKRKCLLKFTRSSQWQGGTPVELAALAEVEINGIYDEC